MSASTTSAGPSTARLVVSISSPMRAEIPEPPAAAAPTCQAMACCARSAPIRCGVTATSAGKTPAREAPSRAKARTTTTGPGCHQMTAQATMLTSRPHPITRCAEGALAGRARPIRTAVSAPQ